MSHNLTLTGYGCSWQTPTDVTFALLKNLKPGTCTEQDVEVLERLRVWVLETCGPAKLTFIEARNTHLLAQYADAVCEINRSVDGMIHYVRQINTPSKRLTGWC
jgi:hypothetical protein